MRSVGNEADHRLVSFTNCCVVVVVVDDDVHFEKKVIFVNHIQTYELALEWI